MSSAALVKTFLFGSAGQTTAEWSVRRQAFQRGRTRRRVWTDISVQATLARDVFVALARLTLARHTAPAGRIPVADGLRERFGVNRSMDERAFGPVIQLAVPGHGHQRRWRRDRRIAVARPQRLRRSRRCRREPPDDRKHEEDRRQGEHAARHRSSCGTYSGWRFHPVSIDAKLSHPCRATITRWPGMNARMPHIARK